MSTASNRQSDPVALERRVPAHSDVAPRPEVPDIEQLFREHGPFVWRTLRRLGLSETDADDLCQEVFLVAMRRLDSFEHRSSLSTWLYGISVRVAVAHRRRASTQREQPWASPPDVPTQSGPHEAVSDRQAREILDRALDVLDDDKRAVFVLFELEQLPMAEVARALDCPLQTAYSRLHAARDHVTSFIRRSTRERWAG
jgi:RNA polymerase sigma-70 factor (ECF subfamily)